MACTLVIAAVHVFIMSEVRIVEVSGLCLLYLEETYSLLKIDFAFFFGEGWWHSFRWTSYLARLPLTSPSHHACCVYSFWFWKKIIYPLCSFCCFSCNISTKVYLRYFHFKFVQKWNEKKKDDWGYKLLNTKYNVVLTCKHHMAVKSCRKMLTL